MYMGILSSGRLDAEEELEVQFNMSHTSYATFDFIIIMGVYLFITILFENLCTYPII